MKKIIVEKLNFLIFLAIFCLGYFLFLVNSGSTSLASWDEAWYAEIARNILKFRNPFLLYWNGEPYYDHPPVGFWLISLSFRFFGINEFSARLPSVLAGFGCLFLLFLIGKKLSGSTAVAFASVFCLATMPWFWLRTRSANLDVFLTCFLLTTLWLSLNFSEEKKRFFWLGFSFGLSLATKTFIALVFSPIFVYILLPYLKDIRKKDIIFLLAGLSFPLIPWYLVNFFQYGYRFLEKNILQVGLRLSEGEIMKFSFLRGFFIEHNLNLIHMGILLWYRFFLLTYLLGWLLLKNKSLRIIYFWITFPLIILSFSGETQIWHLIPLYPGIALLIPFVIYKFGFGILSMIKKFFWGKVRLFSFLFLKKKLVVVFILLLIIFSNGILIIKGLYQDIVKKPFLSQEALMAKQLGKYEGIAYIEDDYWPAAVFYSGKKVINIPFAPDPNLRSINLVFRNSPRPFLILTKEWLIEKNQIGKDQYEILFKNGDRVLIRNK